MGVNISFKSIYGFKNTNKKKTIYDYLEKRIGEDAIEDIVCGDPDIALRYCPDDMCGEYEYLGVSLLDLDEYDDCVETHHVHMTLDVIAKIDEKLKPALDKYGLDYDELVKLYGEPHLHFFVHAS